MSGSVESPVPTPPAAGFLGLGRMGLPIARRWLATGTPLVVWNRSREKAEPILGAGARWADSPRAVGRAIGGGTVGVLVRDTRALTAVLFGRSGFVRGASPGALVVNLTTIAPDESRALAERLSAQGLHYLEAPVGGSTAAAEAGQLLVFAGGSAADLATTRPLLDAIGRRVELVGPVGAGAATKLVNNLLTIGYVALAGEALALADGLGLDRAATLDRLLAGGGRSAMLEQKRPAFERREYPTAFALDLAAKDLKLIERAARETGRPTRLSREVRRLAEEAIRQGHGAEDFAALFEAALARGPARSPPAPAPAPAPETPGGAGDPTPNPPS